MPAVQRLPHPALQGDIDSYYGFTEKTAAPLRRREGPGSSVVVVISFEHEWRMGDALRPECPFGRFTSFVAGLHDAAVLSEHQGEAHGMQINLSPPAAARLFRLDMHELARQIVPFEDVLEGQLIGRLAEATSWDARFELLEHELGKRLVEAPPREPAVEWAWARLRETRGRVRIETLCGELGWSRKRLASHFRREVGLPAKTAARLIRLERAMKLGGAGAAGWAEIAHACGYYDQSHLVNEFREITGVTPTDYLAA
jgi:AraC-like DNA-binding protein